MGNKIIFDEIQCKEIIECYEEGKSCVFIGEKIGVSNKTISRFLTDKGYSIRKRKHIFNERFFERIDTPEKAYWLGFILADGYLHEARGVLKIKLQGIDREHLVKFAKAIEGTEDMIKHEFHNITGNDLYYIEVNSRKMTNDLLNLNIRQGKSSGKEGLSNIPEKFAKDYIRGIFDGDGNIEEKRINVISSPEVLRFIQEYFNKYCYVPINRILNHCNTYRIYICKNREIALNHMYYEGCTALDRKYNFVKTILA